MDTLERIDILLQEIHGRGLAQLIKVKDASKAGKLLKKKGIKWSVAKDGSFAIGDSDFDTAEEALIRAKLYDW